MNVTSPGPYRLSDDVHRVQKVLQKYRGVDQDDTLVQAIQAKDHESVETLLGFYTYKESAHLVDTALAFGSIEILNLLKNKGMLSSTTGWVSYAGCKCRSEEPCHIVNQAIDYYLQRTYQTIYSASINLDALAFLQTQCGPITWDTIIMNQTCHETEVFILSVEDLTLIKDLNPQSPSLDLIEQLFVSYSSIKANHLREMLLFLIPLLPQGVYPPKLLMTKESPLSIAIARQDLNLVRVMLEVGFVVDGPATIQAATITVPEGAQEVADEISRLVLAYFSKPVIDPSPEVHPEPRKLPSLKDRIQQAVPMGLVQKCMPVVIAFLLGQMLSNTYR